MVGRGVRVGQRRARLWVVNGYAEDALIERMIGRLLAVGSLKGVSDLAAFLAAYVTVPDAAAVTEVHDMVMGVFAGHDHVNDYVCSWKGVALAYGRFSGGHTEYHDIPGDNGARVIVLTEGVPSTLGCACA